MEKEFINPESINAFKGATHAISVRGGKLIFTAGQIARDREENLVGKGDFRAQVEKCLENLVAVLAAAGATPRDIVKLNVYIVNYKREHLHAYLKAAEKILPADRMPVGTLVGVAALAHVDYLVEIEGVAAVE
jgi:2-iminobutanoate/2-iminopropanoate deaminase